MTSKDENVEGKPYHERQVKAMCALHVLNNLFQKKQTFTKKDLDQICNRLSPGTIINPHRSMLGLGNYDVNVIMAALQEKGYETIWFDKRKNADVLLPENIMGFILNAPSDYHLGPIRLALNYKHWIALRSLQGQYMNLDSKLSAPEPIGDGHKLVEFLQEELRDGKKELLLVVEKDVYEALSWRKADTDGDLRVAENEKLVGNGVLGGVTGSELDGEAVVVSGEESVSGAHLDSNNSGVVGDGTLSERISSDALKNGSVEPVAGDPIK